MVPFGGAKQSGLGRTGAAEGLLSYSEVQHNFAVRP
jgi:acyl-CoA reductase-like NAD-dependent aldehyde dehydrogenase